MRSVIRLFVGISFLASAPASWPATNFLITSFEGAHSVVWQNDDTSLFYRVEWASDLMQSNAWKDTYISLRDVQSQDTTITSPVPRFFRIAAYDVPMAPSSSWIRVGQSIDGVAGTFWQGDRFEIGTDTNTVIDRKTGLMWPRDQRLGAGTYGVQTNWQGAVDYCDSFGLAGYDDWRLPSGPELQSLLDPNVAGAFALDDLNGARVSFRLLALDFYFWSSTESGTTAFRIKLPGGATHYDSKTSTDNCVFPVRTVTN